uniref:Serpentine receptor class gamma n=1 Tax=Panagrolaimus sp. ES5 TaxID=591445 RepID=A0AC34F7V2_9BILA
MLEIFEISMLSLIVGINFFSLAFLIVVLCSHYVKGMPNPTMKIATLGWLAGLGSISFGVFSFANFSLFTNKLSYLDDWSHGGTYARFFLLYGAFLFRFSVFGAVIERGIATFMIKTYTRYILRILQLIAYYRFNLTKIKLTGMVFFIDSVSFTICLLIRYYNRKLRRRRLSIELSLAERYQVNENIRFLHVILPSALANWFYQSLLASASIIDALGITIPFNNRMLSTHLGYTVLVVLSLFIPSITDGTLVQKLACFAPALKERLFTVIVHPSRNVVNKPDTDVYFNAYQKSWNTPK